jgi:hypothetical protein
VLKRFALSSLSFVLLISCFAPSRGLAAADQVGLTVLVRNDVNQVEPKTSKIFQGDDVIRDELVQTLQDSGAKFVLKDNTNLVLGPNSKLRIDKAVFSDNHSISEIAIKLTTGSFRFITGASPKESYAISTPLATIGVRGTVIDARHEATQDTVRLNEGQARVCLRPPRDSTCGTLQNPGDAIIISANGNMQFVANSDDFFSSVAAWAGNAMSYSQAEDSVTTGSLSGGAAGGGGGTQNGPPSGGSNTGGLALSTTPTTSRFANFLTTNGTSGGGFTQPSQNQSFFFMSPQ